MAMLQLSSQTRTDLSKSNTKKIRREGGVPATVYGHGEEPKAISVGFDALGEIIKTPGGRLSLIDLAIDDKSDKAHPVMIKALQRDPIGKQVIHVDFHRVRMDEAVHASIPVVLLGEAPGVKLGGILEMVISNLEVKALPDSVPTHIDVDISNLEIGQNIHAADLNVPEGVEISNPADAIIVTVRPQHGHAEVHEEAPAEAPAE